MLYSKVAALNPDIQIDTACVKNLFLGSHISYRVADCRLVSLLTKSEQNE